MKKVLQILAFTILFSGCYNNDKSVLPTFSIENVRNVSEVTISDLGFKDIRYIPLETTENSLIRRTFDNYSLRDVLLVGDNYVIIKQGGSILRFNESGTFIGKIGAQGRGPTEFQTCHDIEVSEDGETVFIMDGWKKKIFCYSEPGDFIKTIDLPISGLGIFSYINGSFLCYSDNFKGDVRDSFNLIDSNGVLIQSYSNKYIFTKKGNDGIGYYHENLFYKFKDKLYKKEVLSDTIYSFEDAYFKPHMVIRAGNKLVTPGARSVLSGTDLAKEFISPRNLFEFGDYIYYEFIYKFELSLSGNNSEHFALIGSKRTDFYTFITSNGLINDIDGGPSILPLTTKDSQTLVGLIDALTLKKHVSSESFINSDPKYPEKKKDLENFANNLKDTDNPILILIKLK